MKQYKQLVWTPEMVRNFWDYISRSPEEYFTYQHGAEIVRQIAPLLKQGGEILDFGCGPGYMVERLLAADFRAAGLDTSDDTRKVVADRLSRQSGFLGVFDQSKLLTKGLRFDAITIFEVIEHLYDEQLDDVLGLVRQLLKPEGRLVITTPNEENLEDSYILCPVSNQVFHRWQHVRSWSAATLKEYLQQRGFETVDCFATNFSVSFHPGHSKQPLKDMWRAMKHKVKRRIRPTRKQPHLVAIARLKQETSNNSPDE